MINHQRWSVESAQAAAVNGTLQEWLIAYLRNEGNNEKLARVIEEQTNVITIQPPRLISLQRMKIMVGPPNSGRKWTDSKWEVNIKKFVHLIQTGWNPPPIILTDYWGTPNAITDGNHRYEALKRLGYKKYWAIQLKNKR
ncbi:MAG: hypothetical protein WC553_02075 [Patescibacteria group bacterium]|jgi:hypothetical protein